MYHILHMVNLPVVLDWLKGGRFSNSRSVLQHHVPSVVTLPTSCSPASAATTPHRSDNSRSLIEWSPSGRLLSLATSPCCCAVQLSAQSLYCRLLVVPLPEVCPSKVLGHSLTAPAPAAADSGGSLMVSLVLVTNAASAMAPPDCWVSRLLRELR